MVPKSIFPAAVAVVLLASFATASEYRAGDFLNLDLSKAALSPDPLGPPAHFEQVPIEASAPDKADVPKSKAQHAERKRVHRPRVTVHAKAPHAKLARHAHGNPMDAQARDTRIQVWPCKTGGICNWRRSR